MAVDVDNAELALDRAGPRLKRAREAAGKTLADVSGATKIPERLLAAIEESRFSALPSRIYAIGFARSYARAVGLDETAIVDEVRAEIDGAAAGSDIAAAQAFAPGDPARVPDMRLAIVAALGAVLVLGGGLIFWHGAFYPAGSLPSILPADAPPAKPAGAPKSRVAAAPRVTIAAPPATGAVALSALAPGIWVKVYEAAGKVLFEKEMAMGQTFTVPSDAKAPLVWTGRPDALAITVAGRPVAKLSETQKVVKGVPISAAALLARVPAPAGTPPPAAAIAASARP